MVDKAYYRTYNKLLLKISYVNMIPSDALNESLEVDRNLSMRRLKNQRWRQKLKLLENMT